MSRADPWSSSSLANWLRRKRGLPAWPDSATWEEWETLEQNEKTKAPLLSWFLNVFLERAQKVVEWPGRLLSNFRWYIRNRFYAHTHMLPTGVTPGEWASLDHRLLHANMQALVDFVEVEVAWLQYACKSKAFARKYGVKPRWWRSFRCPQAGIDHLEWETTLDQPGCEQPSPLQTQRAREVLAIYR